MLDQRKNVRRKTYLGARAIFLSGCASADCLVRNVGEGGARLVFEEAAFLPDEFEVQIHNLRRSYRARVAWRSQLEIGVAFTDLARRTILTFPQRPRAG